ncbi:uncharacterized protein LOC129593270 isoform X2 [Paramacrobiotus metropolitanus]|uniref:uncharacterized protein LOC129593270 isoform X2 n=1 Tax=Paramacrobiotus metropolitanus TaxID=2943436 RepID=UPI002445B0B6|nr:uncharacterized protein LOC129593270 isoform X2 [Paramacrobiotus metropolitanus]
MTAPTTPRLSLRLPKRHFSLKSAFRTVRSFVPVKNIPSIENSPRSPTPENFQTSSSDLVRQVRFKMYEDFSLKAIERKFLARDIDRLSTSDALVLRILQEENGDVARAYQWLVNLLSWRRHFGVHKLPCESRNEMYETLSFVRGDQFSLLTCDAVKLHNAVGIHGLVPLIRQIVSIFEKIWNNGDTACLSLVISFAYMDPESWLKISTRHLLNELICGCAYYRYPGLCDKIVLVNWRSDEQSLELYDNILAKDWPFGVKKRVRFAQHDEVLKYVLTNWLPVLRFESCEILDTG